jgi:hypothetical protein
VFWAVEKAAGISITDKRLLSVGRAPSSGAGAARK